MRAVYLALAVVTSLILSNAAAAADLNIGTWNLMRAGSGDQKSYAAAAAVVANVDIMAVQEVMTDEALEKLESALEARTKESWSTMASSPAGSKNYKEMYAFVWRDRAVEYVDGAVSYLPGRRIFIREPFSARFRAKADGGEFVLATVHILYGKSEEERTPELVALGDYWSWLEEVYPGQSLLLMGDFNMDPSKAPFTSLRRYAVPLIRTGASTLSAKDSAFANLYDNAWVSRSAPPKVAAAGVVNYPRMIGWHHAKSRQHVSDHAPIFISLGKARLASTVQFVKADGAQRMASFQSLKPAANDSVFGSVGSAVAQVRSQDQGPIRGNRNSMIYHRTSCPSYDSISPKNRVEFASEAAAKAQGYRLAGNCK